MNPGLYGRKPVRRAYAKPIQRHGDAVATAALRTLTQPFILRRTKADKTLLPELPDKIEQIAWASLTREQAAMYQAVVDQLLADAQAARRDEAPRPGARRAHTAEADLQPPGARGGRRLADRRDGRASSARFDELVDELLEVGERALVFTQFREMGLILQRHLRDRLQIGCRRSSTAGSSRAGRDAMVAPVPGRRAARRCCSCR